MYHGKYPSRIKSVSYSDKADLFLESNDGTKLQLTPNEVQKIINTESGMCLPVVGDDISVWEDHYWVTL